jgi:hypothetical protein
MNMGHLPTLLVRLQFVVADAKQNWQLFKMVIVIIKLSFQSHRYITPDIMA